MIMIDRNRSLIGEDIVENLKIQLPESLKNFGTFEVPIKLHPQVTGKLIVKVTEKE